ncbi:MAG: hemerythrin domain-containing protein [Rhodocyclales bacterium]|nr:hemerythrin domain-containing protein [Rhodocyclales bacterium]
MSTITTLFTRDHRRADEDFAAVEAALLTGPLASALDAWETLEAELQHHFLTEEEALFPAFETATGMSGGPTEAMRLEHTQMRELFAPLAAAIEAGETESVRDLLETLLVMLQQHNMKEENVLYPLCDQALAAAQREAITRRLAATSS